MKCDMNCAACTRLAKKCHGGSYRTPYTCRDCVPTLNRCGKRVKEK